MSRVAATAAPPTTTTARSEGLHVVSPSDSATEREADRFADAGAGRRVIGWSFADVPAHPGPIPTTAPGTEPGPTTGPELDVRLGGPGRPLDPALGAPPGLRVHTDGAAADTASRAGSEAVTVGRDIAFAPGRYQPGTAEGRWLIAHEVAHAAQTARAPGRMVAHRNGGGPVTPATTLSGLPEADRKRIQVVTTTTVVVGGMEEKFSIKGGSMTLSLPANTTVALDPSVDAKLAHGMGNVAAALTTTADVSPAPLPENTTATLRLDLRKPGGTDGLYRFTFHAPPAAGRSTPAKRVIVEQLGGAKQVPGAQAPPEPGPGKPAQPDPVADKMKAAGITHSFPNARLADLRAAISTVPAAHLAVVSGLKLKTAPDDPARPDVAGDYSPDTHTVTMYAKAFNASQSAFENGAVATSYASRAILHEIGHAVDLASLRKARAARETAVEAVNAAAGTFTSKAQEDAYRTAVQAAENTRRTLLRTTTRSGSATAPKKGETEPVDVIGTAAKGFPFREAVRKDGKNVSKYGEKDWQESYAEAYSLYLTSPDTLEALRPATFDHLDKSLPK